MPPTEYPGILPQQIPVMSTLRTIEYEPNQWTGEARETETEQSATTLSIRVDSCTIFLVVITMALRFANVKHAKKEGLDMTRKNNDNVGSRRYYERLKPIITESGKCATLIIKNKKCN